MKCPKCQYISFDSGERCRNCGYDFSLAPDVPDSSAADADDLPIQNGTEALGPLADFSLNETPNLPLFTGGRGDPDAPLVMPGGAPRAPLAVRRAAPAPSPPRPRSRRESPREEPRLALDTAEIQVVPLPSAAEEPVEAQETAAATAIPPAGAGARLAGGAVDVVLLGSIDLIIVYLTLRVCDLTFAQTLTLPLAPLGSFLALLNGGYLTAFVAASGQTIGKMAAGTRVVSDDGTLGQPRVSFEQAVLRAAASMISTLPLGLGFVPALIGRDRRALHDRLADTRVVKA